MLGQLLSFLMGPGGKFGASVAGGHAQQQAYADANRANEQRFTNAQQLGIDSMMGGMGVYDAGAGQAYQELLGRQGQGNQFTQGLGNQLGAGYADRTAGVLGGFDRSAQQLQQGYGLGMNQFLSQFNTGADRINQGYGDRYQMASDQLEGFGRQAEADIDRRYDDERGSVEQDLINRGMMSSLGGGGDLLGVGERRTGEQRRLQESLMQNRTNILGQFSGQGLAAQERLLGQGSGYGYGGLQSGYGMAGRLQDARSQYDAALRGDELNNMASVGQWQQGIGDQYSNNLANFLGQNAAQRAGMFQQGMGNLQNLQVGRTDVAPPGSDNIARNFGWGAPKQSGGGGNSNDSWIGPSIQGGALMAATMLGSDENVKESIHPVNNDDVLKRLRELHISTWKYKDDPKSLTHIGPMAQDFKEAFQLGGDDRSIAVVDAMGVLMSSVKALAQKVDRLEKAVA